MFGSQILDVCIGLFFVFALLSMLCSAVREVIESVLKSRARHLERGIRELLADPDGTGLARRLYSHPQIASLYSGRYPVPAAGRSNPAKDTPPDEVRGFFSTRRLPSYVPSRSFAVALLDIVVGDARNAAGDRVNPSLSPLSSLTAVRESLAGAQGDTQVGRVVLNAIDASRYDPDRVRVELERWYDDTMDRVSGWYKRQTQWILLGVGALTAVVLNANAITIARHLYQDGAARDAIVASAGAVGGGAEATGLRDLRAELASLPLPIGWENRPVAATTPTVRARSPILNLADPNIARQVLVSIPGWIITAFAISLGAPFWFDLLNKFMVIRSTVKPHEKSPNEGSEDNLVNRAAPGGGNLWVLPAGPVPAAPEQAGEEPREGARGELLEG